MAKDSGLIHVPQSSLEKIHGWSKLPERERLTVFKETDELAQSIEMFGKMRLKIGGHLCKIRDILEPRRIFKAYLKSTPWGFSVATAYRYIQIYEQAKTILPAPVMKVALLRGMDTLNVELVKVHRPPNTEDPE